jgi:hypothetical protein
MVPVSRKVRAYFAPVNRETESPAVFDPGKHGAFELDAPPSPWLDLGWIDNFERISATKTNVLSSGSPPVPLLQYRTSLEAQVEFDFREWGKLQMALSGGAQHMNVLAEDANADPQPSGGTPLSAVAVLPGSTASELVFGPGAVDVFNPGDLLAVDLDYQQQIGYVGSGVAAAYVRDPTEVRQDTHYIRRVTFNVGRVAEKTATSVLLAQPLIGGAPGPGAAAAQKILAFTDRDGGSFFQEWSALFVLQEDAGGRLCFYYPRLSPGTLNASKTTAQRETRVDLTKPIAAIALHASFVALPHKDGNDGELALCYRTYFPASGAAVY